MGNDGDLCRDGLANKGVIPLCPARRLDSLEVDLRQIVQSRGLENGEQQAFCWERPDDFALAILHSAKSMAARTAKAQLSARYAPTTLHYLATSTRVPGRKTRDFAWRWGISS